MHIKRFTLTSKKNWWMVELDEEEESPPKSAIHPPPPYTTDHSLHRDDPHRHDSAHVRARSRSRQRSRPPTRPPSPEQYNPPRRPNAIFSFPTPSIYSAGPNPTASMQPFTQGSASELFKCVVKKPEYVTLEINGEVQSNAIDVATQFLAELRVYTTVSHHRNLPVFLGCLDGVGMVMEYIEGRTLYQFMKDGELTRSRKCDFHNQLLDAMCHVHSFGLSHGDLSTLNIQVTHNGTTLKLFDFGRSVAATSVFAPPDGEPVDPFAWMTANPSATPRVEQIHPGTRPFSAPEILRGECQDACLADAYSFGMILVCLERSELVDAKPWEQRKDKLPTDLFNGCTMWVDRIKQYLARFDSRRRLMMEDMVMILDD
ncbi:kinase-like protein [Vararia minispora EC-137]|uniref:Kinase-like protein n=1 Tax=Vararia minispora EC-137 TaxID=1314806 RepID=A0ACB8QZ44_9AGAM|nr:kinase-like protein [Vararia minispora EC-137]